MTEIGRQRLFAALGGLVGLSLVGLLLFGGGEAEEATPAFSPAQSTPENGEADTALLEEIRPAFDLVRISRGGTGVIAGRMAPGAEVALMANGRQISSVTADENGEWVIILDEPLEAGSVELNLMARAGAAEEIEGEDVVVVSVPERENETFMERRENGVVAVLTPKSGDGASRVLQRPGAAAFAEVGDSLRIDTLDYGNGSAVVAGQALPRVEVRIYLDDRFLGAEKVDDSGRWSLALGQDIAPGNHTLRVDQTLTGNDVQLRILQPFVTGTPLDPATAEGGVLVQPGNTLWQIARRLYGSGVRYTLIFRENSEQIDDPDKIYPGQVFRLPGDDTAAGR